MALLDIIEAPDPRLTKVSAPIERVDAELCRLLDDMLETMYAAPGIGLAAPQVGQLVRACVIDVGGEEERRPICLVNPRIVWRSDSTTVAEEGCLSLPKQFAEVKRADEVQVRYVDPDGESREVAGAGILARCLQHEIDHLDGILFVDHISALKRSIILRRLAKAKRMRAHDDS
jgi:peptide deformylase